MDAQDLKNWRRQLGLTQKQAADALGITLRGYQKREAGATPIDLDGLIGRADSQLDVLSRLHAARVVDTFAPQST